MLVKFIFAAVLCAVCAADKPPSKNGWSLKLLKEAAQQSGSVCLDGSPAGYYIQKGNGTGSQGWMLHLQGGGWCVNMDDCVARSKMFLGSSNSFADDMDSTLSSWDGGTHGLFSSNSTTNPRFYNYNKVYVRYCDGASFAGNVENPLKVGSDTIYFRGRRVLDAVLDDLLVNQGLNSGKDFIVNGCSAGGLAVYLHLDYIRAHTQEKNPGLVVKGVPECGMFMDLNSAVGQPSYTPNFQWAANAQNVSGSVNSDCVKSVEAGKEWQCFMAQYTLPHIKTPHFVINSFYDAWQFDNILEIDQCGPDNMCREKAAEGLRGAMLAALEPTYAKNGSAAYLYSCVTHCAQFNQEGRWSVLAVNGRTLRDAFTAWYDDKEEHSTHIDCDITSFGRPCNPTCRAD
jgi:hypothetical protein